MTRRTGRTDRAAPPPGAPKGRRRADASADAGAAVAERGPPATGAVAPDLPTLGSMLDQLEVAFCAYDAGDRVVAWNAAYLDFFPEQAADIRPGTPYADTLRRFFRSNLPAVELPLLETHVEAGVQRHRAQRVPFVFQRSNGRWLKVASLPLAEGGRLRLWRDVTASRSGAATMPTARALAALDVAYAVFDRAGRFVTANKRYQELFPGLGDLIEQGATYSDHLLRMAEASVAPEERETLARLAQRQHPADSPVSMPMMLPRSDEGWLQLEERHGDDGSIVAIWSNATRQAEAEAKISQLERYLREAVDGIPHGLLLFDGSGHLALVNRQLERIDAGLARAMAELPQRARFEAWRAALTREGRTQHSGAGGSAEIEEFSQPDGRTVRVTAVRTGDADLLVLLSDVTRERAAEAELRRQRELSHQNEKLAALGSLLAGVAHELNNPLSVVVGRALMLQEDISDPRYARPLHALRQAAERCARIVSSFLAVARQKRPERHPVRIESVLDAVCDMLAYSLRTAGIEVERRYRSEGVVVEGDEDGLHQVFLNLVVNAQHALQDAPRPRRILIDTALHDGMMVVHVADTGPGVPAQIRARIFDPYFTTKPQGTGTGIGLSVTHGIVSAHGGTISVGDRPGGGALFTIELPVMAGSAVAGPPAGGPDQPVAADATGGTLTGPLARILVVDDEADIVEMVVEILDRAGFATSVATDGGEALRRLGTERFDLVITDLRMPGIDGHELLTALRRRPAATRPKLLVLTGDTRAERQLDRDLVPPGRLLEKPGDLPALLGAVQEALGLPDGTTPPVARPS